MSNTFEHAITLIKAELQNLKFINGLDSAGIDASAYMLDFSSLILEMLGFKHETSDEFYEWYFCHQNKLVKNIDPENDKEFQERAFDFYVDLVVKKRELDRIFCGPDLKCS